MRIAAAACMLLMAGPALASDPRPAPNPRANTRPGDRMVCRSTVPTGSIMAGPRVCRRQSEIDRQAQDSQDRMRSAAPQAAGSTGN